MAEAEMRLLRELQELIDELHKPVSYVEERDGWRQETKDRVGQYFDGLRKRLESGEALPPLDVVRSLDHSGVTSGPLLARIAKLSNMLRQRKEHPISP